MDTNLVNYTDLATWLDAGNDRMCEGAVHTVQGMTSQVAGIARTWRPSNITRHLFFVR